MALQFEHSFVVKASPDRVWAYLTDPYRVAPALPGASITEQVDEQTWGGGITVKVGPVSAKYKGTVRFEALDPAARTAEIVARGQDTSGRRRGHADKGHIVERGGGESESPWFRGERHGRDGAFWPRLIRTVEQDARRFTEAMRAELRSRAGDIPARPKNER